MPRNTRPGTRAAWSLCAVVAVFCISLAGCRQQGPTAQTQARRFQLSGTVVSIDKAQGHLLVDHKEIPGFMSAMTMPYPVADPRVLDQVAAGDQIAADVVTGDSGPRLENIVVVKKSDGTQSPRGSQLQQLRQESPVPDFVLVNQDGKRIDLHQYVGKSVLLTFIYTRCPLPDYCPLMSHNFAVIDKELAKTPAIYAKTHLLSISFDPKNDTPDVLREYGREYTPDKGKLTFDHWDFAAVPATERSDVTKFFDVFYNEQDGQITHSMSTAIISPDGKLYKWYDGNEWRPADVLADLVNSLSGQSQGHPNAPVPH